MKNFYKVILSLLVLISCNENTIASNSDEESELSLANTNYASDNNSVIFNLQELDVHHVLTEEEYIHEVIPDINDILLGSTIFRINISNVIHAVHNCNALGWDDYDNQFDKLLQNDKNKFIKLLEHNNIEIKALNNSHTIFERLLRELKNSFTNNPDVFMNILQFLEDISENDINVMQSNIGIVKNTLLMTDIKKIEKILLEGFNMPSVNQIMEKEVQPRIDKFIIILNKLNRLQIRNNRLREINNKLININNNVLEYLYFSKKCLNTIETESLRRISAAIGIISIPAIVFLVAIDPSACTDTITNIPLNLNTFI